MSETYTVHMRGKIFELTRDQIEFDSPNYFTSCFFGDFTESRTRTVTLSRDPKLFRIILDYLSGYRILPLHDAVIPRRMSSETALENLLADAQFYQLDALIENINQKLLESKFIGLIPQSPYILLNLQKRDSKPKWSPIVFVAEMTAQRMREEHGVSRPVMFAIIVDYQDEVRKILADARVPTSYMVVGCWFFESSTKADRLTFLLRLVK